MNIRITILIAIISSVLTFGAISLYWYVVNMTRSEMRVECKRLMEPPPPFWKRYKNLGGLIT